MISDYLTGAEEVFTLASNINLDILPGGWAGSYID